MDHAGGPTTVAVGGATFAVDPKAVHARIWDPMTSGDWEPETVHAVTAVVGPGSTVVDVGAWIGPLTLLSAALGATVRSYEPDPVARTALLANLAVNDFGDRVEVVAAGLGASAGEFELHSGELGDSMSSLVRGTTTGTSTTVEVRDAASEAAAHDFAGADLVKMDVEGAEFDVLPRLVPLLGPLPPDLLLSTHAYPAVERSRSWLPAPLRRWTPVVRGWNLVSRRVVAPVLMVVPQVRLARLLRRYPFRYVAERNGGEWRPLRRRDMWRQLVAPPKSAEFWLSCRDRLSGRPAAGRAGA